MRDLKIHEANVMYSHILYSFIANDFKIKFIPKLQALILNLDTDGAEYCKSIFYDLEQFRLKEILQGPCMRMIEEEIGNIISRNSDENMERSMINTYLEQVSERFLPFIASTVAFQGMS